MTKKVFEHFSQDEIQVYFNNNLLIVTYIDLKLIKIGCNVLNKVELYFSHPLTFRSMIFLITLK